MKKLQYTLFIYCLFGSGLFTLKAQLSHIEGFGIGNYFTPENSINEIIVDSLGNFYAIGTFNGTLDFNPLGAPYFLASPAGDAFIAKYNTQRELVWAHALGGVSSDFGLQIAFGKNNDLLIGGHFTYSVDFNPSPAPGDTFIVSGAGITQICLARFDTSGNFIWAGGLKEFGIGNRNLSQLLADETGNIIAYGHFANTIDFDPAIGTSTTRTSLGSTDLFVLKLSPEGEFLDVQQFGSTMSDIASDLVFMPGGNYFISGCVYAPVDFDPSDSTAIIGASTKDGFIAKYSADMRYLAGILIEGPGNNDGVGSLDINTSGTKILVNGGFSDSLEINPLGNSFKVFGSGFSKDILVAMYDTSLHLITGFKIGGASTFSDFTTANTFEAHTDNFWIAGHAAQCDLDPSPLFYGTPQNSSNYNFIAQYDSLGNYRYSYAFEASGGYSPTIYCLEYRNDNELLIAGKYFDSIDLDFNPNVENSFSSPGTGYHMFLGSYALCRANYTFNNEFLCQGDSLLLNGNYYTSGDTLTIYGTTSEGCDSVQRYSFFTSPSDFTPVIAPSAVCSGSTLLLQADSNLSNVQWETGLSGSVLSLNAPETAGMYIYAYSALLNGCTVSDSAEIEVNEPPTLDLGDDLFLCENEDVVISGPVGNFIYSWSTGDTEQFIELTPGSLPFGSNQITLTVIDTLGCSGTDSLLVQVEECLNTTNLAAEAGSLIYPNPCTSKIWIVAPHAAEKNPLIRIYTPAGQLVQEQFAVDAVVDVSALNRGLYILTVVSNNPAIPVMFLKN